MWFFIDFPMEIENDIMVEAAGIEPASRSTLQTVLHT